MQTTSSWCKLSWSWEQFYFNQKRKEQGDVYKYSNANIRDWSEKKMRRCPSISMRLTDYRHIHGPSKLLVQHSTKSHWCILSVESSPNKRMVKHATGSIHLSIPLQHWCYFCKNTPKIHVNNPHIHYIAFRISIDASLSIIQKQSLITKPLLTITFLTFTLSIDWFRSA